MEKEKLVSKSTTKDSELAEKVKAVIEIGNLGKSAIENQTKDNTELFDLLKKEMDATKPSDEFYKLAQQAMRDNNK